MKLVNARLVCLRDLVPVEQVGVGRTRSVADRARQSAHASDAAGSHRGENQSIVKGEGITQLERVRPTATVKVHRNGSARFTRYLGHGTFTAEGGLLPASVRRA